MERVGQTEKLSQINMFEALGKEQYKITKPVRLIELFAGIGAQAKALENLGMVFEHYKVCEFEKYAIKSYNAIHQTNFETSDIRDLADLRIIDKDKYEYILTYSFPCTDLSLAGKRAGMTKGSGTRSGLLWEVERMLKTNELPQILLMENVPQVLNSDFHDWQRFLETLGYSNYTEILNAKDYGIPQNRERCFMISILGDYYYGFPEKQRLQLRLKDMLEDEVDEKYYLSEKGIEYLKRHENAVFNGKDSQLSCTVVSSYYKRNRDSQYLIVPEATKKGFAEAHEGDSINLSRPNSETRRGRVGKGIVQTLTTGQEQVVVVEEPICLNSKGGRKGIDGLQPSLQDRVYDPDGISTAITTSFMPSISNNLRIRKLTPKECFRLMGFSDQDFEKAAFRKEIYYLEGEEKCNVKLKIVNEKQRHSDTETFVFCTTNDMTDTGIQIQTKWEKSILAENCEKLQNVSFAIEMLEKLEQRGCVTNIIKCGGCTVNLYTLMEELGQHRMAIIELEEKGKMNTERYMRITLEESLVPMRLFITSTLIEQIIESKIYTYMIPQVNIQGNIAIIEDCEKNLKMMKLLNLKMEHITRLNSNSALYKQAGNSIVVTVLMAIFKQFL